MKVDYIIVGCGLAGIAFCEQLRKHNHSFLVFDDNSQQSSVVAAGLYNSVILKRFSKVWKSKEQLELLDSYYKELESLLNVTLDYRFPILRKFASTEEQNLWFLAMDKPELEPYLSPKLIKNTYPSINADFGFGEVLHAGRVDTPLLVSQYKLNLQEGQKLKVEVFDYSVITFGEESITYKDIETKHVVFAEGFGIKHNPYFDSLPLNGTKGEVLTIKAPDLKIDVALKSSVFVIPIGNDIYKVGATYNWDDKSNNPTKKGEEELVSKLKTLVTCDFEIVNHSAGVRPTVKDRRPLVGRHSNYKGLYILNGLGTRGVMIAPYVAEQLYGYIENNSELDLEIDIQRFVQ